MKRKFTFRRLLWTLLISVIVSVLGINVIRNTTYYQSVDRNFFGFFSMVKYGLVDYPIQTVQSFSKDIATLWNVRYENDLYRQELDKAYQISKLYEAQLEEIERLKALNNLTSTFSEYTMITGKVMNRSLEQWDYTLTIDKGSADGVEVGDGVMTEYGIIGRIIEVNENSSILSLLTSNSDTSKVSVRIEVSPSEFVFGILESYDTEAGVFNVNLLETSDKIAANQKVTTSGIGGIYATGIEVGAVESVRNISDGIGKIVMVKSHVNFDDLRYVVVVKLP